MPIVRVSNTLADLAADTREVAVTAKAKFAAVTKRNVAQGAREAQRIARAASGPHGRFYYKRISSEMLSPLSGEWGPHGGGTPVGAGWRHGPGNTDMAKSADVQVPKFAGDVSDAVDGLFWPGGDR